MNIYVGNLSYQVEEEYLRGMFEEYGTVTDVKIITDKISGKSKGFGFVEMEDSSDANKAINELNGTSVENRDLVVNEARERQESNNRKRY